MAILEGKAPNGKGGVNQQAIDSEGLAYSRAIIEDDFQHAVDEGSGYIFYSTYSLTGGEEALFLQNDGVDIHLDKCVVSTSASGIVSVMRQTSGTAAGTTITGKNGIFGRPVMGTVTAFGNASVTGSVDGDTIDAHDIGTSTPHTFELDGLIVPITEAVFVRFATNGVVHVTLYVHRLPAEV